MKKAYFLINFQFSYMLKKSAVVCLALILAQNALFLRTLMGLGTDKIMGRKPFETMRLEQLMFKSGFHIIFLICYIFILVIIALSVYSGYFRSKSIYTIMTLPVDRWAIFLNYFVSGVMLEIMLCISQIISVYLCHEMLKAMATYKYMNNAVFLSFIQWDFLKLFLPLNILELIKTVILLASPVVTVLYVVFSERSDRHIHPFVAIALFLWFSFYSGFLSLYRYKATDMGGWILFLMHTLLIVGLTVFIAVRSVNILNSKEII